MVMTSSMQVADPWAGASLEIGGHPAIRDRLRAALGYAVLAPSSHNTQPWRFALREDSVEVYADRSRALRVVDPDGRELAISCGAALFHLRLAMRALGYARRRAYCQM